MKKQRYYGTYLTNKNGNGVVFNHGGDNLTDARDYGSFMGRQQSMVWQYTKFLGFNEPTGMGEFVELI